MIVLVAPWHVHSVVLLTCGIVHGGLPLSSPRHLSIWKEHVCLRIFPICWWMQRHLVLVDQKLWWQVKCCSLDQAYCVAVSLLRETCWYQVCQTDQCWIGVSAWLTWLWPWHNHLTVHCRQRRVYDWPPSAEGNLWLIWLQTQVLHHLISQLVLWILWNSSEDEKLNHQLLPEVIHQAIQKHQTSQTNNLQWPGSGSQHNQNNQQRFLQTE